MSTTKYPPAKANGFPLVFNIKVSIGHFLPLRMPIQWIVFSLDMYIEMYPKIVIILHFLEKDGMYSRNDRNRFHPTYERFDLWHEKYPIP